MAVIAPSSTGSPAAGQTPQQRQIEAADAGARMSENFLRQMQGLGEMEGAELDRFNRRQDQQTFRQNQLAEIEQGLADRDAQAAEMEQTLRESGLADVAERFRRASRSQGFNAARRGLQGGSADIQQQAQMEADAGQEAEQVAANAAQQRIGMQMANAREAASMQAALQEMDPFEAMMMEQELTGLGDQMNVRGRMAEANRQIQQGNRMKDSAWAGGLSSFLGSAGQVGMAGLVGSA